MTGYFVPSGSFVMEPWDLFGMTEDEFHAEEDAAQAASEAAQAAFLESTENYEQEIGVEELRAENNIRERFRLMEYMKDVMRPVLPRNSSVMKCYKVPCSSAVTYSQGVDERGKAIAKVEGVSHDHSVHFCPMCSFKIAVKRAWDITQITDRAKAEGFGLYHMILTIRHSKYDPLDVLMDEFKAALQSFWRNGSVRLIYNDNWEYRFDTMEVMFGFDDADGEGGNGMHVHMHITLIGKQGVDCAALQAKLEPYWIRSLGGKGKAGGVALKLKEWEDKELAHYLTKLPTASFEMSMGAHTKHGKQGEDKDKEVKGEHFGFFQVARIAMKYKGLRRWLEPLIREYYFVTKGRKLIQFSRGLLSRFGVADKTDDELAEDGGEVLKELATVSNGDYKTLTHLQIAESRILARRGVKSALWDYFGALGVICHNNKYELEHYWNDNHQPQMEVTYEKTGYD